MPQWVLEVVSKQPGGEYDEKFQRYAAIGVLYYTIYNPSYYRRDQHEVFEVYKLTQGQYVRQLGNPVWLPEIGLGIGHEMGSQEGIQRDWLYWYDERGNRYPAPEDALKQERILREQEQILREREQLLRRAAEERLTEAEQARIEAQQALELERSQSAHNLAQERRSIALNLLRQGLAIEAIAQATGLTITQLQQLQAQTEED